MSTKMSVPSRTTRSSVQIPKTSTRQSNTKTKTQEVELMRDIKQCLKLIQSEDLHLIDTDGLKKEILIKPQSGDHLQYELHNYCKRNLNSETDSPIVYKLVQICYSDQSVSYFTSMDRFVGCAYYVAAYLLKRMKYKSALEVAHSLSLKKGEILNCSKGSKDIQNFLYNLHSNFIASAIILASKVQNKSDENYKLSHELAIASLKFFEYTNTEQTHAGKKVIKTTASYFHTIKHYRDADVIQFYGILKGVLKTLLKKFCELDYLLIVLHKVDKVNSVDSSKGLEMYHHLKRIMYLMSILLELSPVVRTSLEGVLESFFEPHQFGFYPSESVSQTFTSLSDSKGILCFVLISFVFSHGLQFWWRTYEDDWSKKMTTALIQKLFKSYFEIFEARYWNACLFCSSSDSPYESCLSDLLTGNLHKIQYTIRLCLKNKVANSLNLISLSRQAFKLSLECVDLMRRKGCCNTQRIYAWKHSVIHHTNTVEDILRHTGSDESWLHLKSCSEELLRNILNTDMELPFDIRRATILFQRWHHAVLKLKKFNESLFVCVLFYICYPCEENDVMSMWLQTKFESSNEILQETTMSELLKTCDSDIKNFVPKHRTSMINMKCVLLMELKAYSSCSSETFKNPKTYHSLVSRIWKQLEKLELNLWEISFALTCLVSTNLSGDDDKLPKIFKAKCNDVINKLMNWEKEGKAQCRSLLHAANLSFSLFLYNVKVAEMSEGKMESSQMVLGYLKKVEEEKVKYGEDVDLNLTCNVIPSSSKLTVELETNYLNALNEIVELWKNALESGQEELPTASEFESWLQNVKQVAHLYELIGEYQRSFTTWLLFYKIGKLCSDSVAILSGLSHIMENCSDVDESGLNKEAECISKKLGNENQEKYVLIEYWLSLASNYLKNKKSTKCLECLLKAKKVLEGLRTTVKTYALNARFWCLVSQFLCLYPHYEVEFGYKPGTDLRVMAFKAFNYANVGARNDFIKTVTREECTELVLAMLEVNLWAYYLHGAYSQTDFMRFFLDDLYQIVQKLFLPSRTAEILVRLAEVDMICEKSSDCQEKVTKLKSILTTLSSTCDESSVKEVKKSPYMSVPKSQSVEKPSPRAISPARFLDKPTNTWELDPSPVHHHLKEVKTTESLRHVRKCKCRLCQNLLIQVLTMNTSTLEGELYCMENSLKKAHGRYCQAHLSASKLEISRAEQNEILMLKLSEAVKTDPGEFDFRLRWVQFHTVRFLIKAVGFELKSTNAVTENVRLTMEKVSRTMKKFSYEEKLLTWTFTELKLLIVVMSKGGESKKRSTDTPVEFKPKIVTKTPFISQTVKAQNGAALKADKICKNPSNVQIIVPDVVEEDSDSDPKNKAFIGLEKLPEDKKADIQPKKLSFSMAEAVSGSKLQTVIKAQRERMSHIKPRKLNLDAPDSEEKEKPNGTKKTTGMGVKSAPAMVTRSKKENIPATGKGGVRTTIKIHTDSENEKRPKKILSDSKRNVQESAAGPKKTEKKVLTKKTTESEAKNSKSVKKNDQQNVSVDLFLS